MGDIKKLKKKFTKPGHPWQKLRIEEEKKVLLEFGLKNKRELWKTSSKMKNFADQAKKLIAARGKQAEVEKKQLISKLNRLGLVSPDADLDDVLGLSLKDYLGRRLQTVLVRKGIARSLKQSRQFITHEQIIMGHKKITSPSYLVDTKEEPLLTFDSNSALANPDHPERTAVQAAPKKESEAKKE